MNELLIQDFLSGKTYDFLCKKYHHKFSTVKKILKDNNISLEGRENKEYRTDKTISQEEIENFLELYRQGRSLNFLAKTFRMSVSKVRKLLKKNGVTLRKVSNKKYYLNEDYFDSLTENGAYILGFFAADGWVRRDNNLIELSLSEKDSEILEKIKKELSLKRPIRHFEDSKGNQGAKLTFSSEKIKKVFGSYGVIPNKTFTLKHLPEIPKNLLIHYIRGYFDGDGSICQGKMWTICSVNKSFLEDIVSFLEDNFSIPAGKIYVDKRKKNPVYFFEYFSKDSLKKLFEILYQGNFLRLERKYLTFQKAYNEIINHETPLPQHEEGKIC